MKARDKNRIIRPWGIRRSPHWALGWARQTNRYLYLLCSEATKMLYFSEQPEQIGDCLSVRMYTVDGLRPPRELYVARPESVDSWVELFCFEVDESYMRMLYPEKVD